MLANAVVFNYFPLIFNPSTTCNKTEKNNFRPSSIELVEAFFLHI